MRNRRTDLLPMVLGDDEGDRLGLVRHLCQDFPVESKHGSWLEQSLNGDTGLHGQVQAEEAVVCTRESTRNGAETESWPQRSVLSRLARSRKRDCSPTLQCVSTSFGPGWAISEEGVSLAAIQADLFLQPSLPLCVQ